MIKGAILFGLAGAALGLAALSLVPNFPPAGTPAAPAAFSAGVPRSDEVAPAQETAGYREASLAADSRGQYTADALVNGSPVRMMVDTGASAVVISAATAARIGVFPGPGPKWRD